ncbi:MAG: phosphoglycerate dehydrogenase [Bdellovibrionaceae bacterium]|nr:phosphoglycerate dehydrogenase [Pseudobdellovibrionaceae bacterium]
MKKKILICDRFSLESLHLLEREDNFEFIKIDPDQLLDSDQLAAAEALLIRSRVSVTAELLKKAKKLQVIITATSGFDHIDLDSTAKWGITVMNTPSANRESAAQLTLTLMLALNQRLLEAHRLTKAGLWRQEHILGTELDGKTWGIVGLGRIGSRVAELARAFRMNVISYDPYLDDEGFERYQAKRVSYEELLKLADVISFHVPKTKETHKMLNASHFEYINREVFLVNTSRGTVIDEESLVKALENRWLRGVALDVYEKEPLPRSSKLLNFPEVILTPHIGAYTEDAFFRASEDAILKLIRFFRDGTTSDTLPPKADWYTGSHFSFV